MNCCDHENRLTLFLLGDLSERDEAEFSRHLADCARCQENARMLSPVLKALETGLARDHVRTPRFDLHHQLTLLSVPAESTHRLVDWMVRARPWLVAAASGMVVTGLIYAVVFSSMLQQYGWNRRPTPTPGGWARVDCEAFSGVYLNGGRVLQPVFSEWTESATNAAHADRWGVVLALDFTEMPAAGTEQIPETPLDLPSDRECGPRYAQLEDKAKMVESAAAHFKGVTRYASSTM